MQKLTKKEVDVLEGLYSMGSIYNSITHISSISKVSSVKTIEILNKFNRKRPNWIEHKPGEKIRIKITKAGRQAFINWEKKDAQTIQKKFYGGLSIGVATYEKFYINSAFRGGWSYTARRGAGSSDWNPAKDVIKKAKESNMKIFLSGIKGDWKDFPDVKRHTEISPKKAEDLLKRYIESRK